MVAHKFPDLASQTTSEESVVPRYIPNASISHEINLITRAGTVESLSAVLSVMEIYEDIFNPSISGHVELIDFVGGLEKFQITGGEKLSVKILKPEGTEVLLSRDDLVIHTVSKADVVANNTIRYRLEFTTASAIKSQRKRVYKSYGNQKDTTAIVKDLCEMIGEKVNVSNTLPKLDNTYTIPGYTPIQAINYLAKRACASGDYFLFFERLTTGKVFAGIGNLRSLAPKTSDGDTTGIYTIAYTPSTSYIEAAGAETNMLTEYVQLQPNFNHMINMNKGFYRTKLTNVNIARRKFETQTFDYRDGPNDFYVNDLLNDDSEFGAFEPGETPGERMFTPAINDPVANKIGWIKNDLHGALLMSGMRVNVRVEGSVNQLGAGDIVNLVLPSDMAKSANPGSSEMVENNMYSGKYFVTACRHVISNELYGKELELSRASVRESLFGNTPVTDVQEDVTAEQGYIENASGYIEDTLITIEPDDPVLEDQADEIIEANQGYRPGYIYVDGVGYIDLGLGEYGISFEGYNPYYSAGASGNGIGTSRTGVDGSVSNYELDGRLDPSIRKELIRSQRWGTSINPGIEI